jgi:hypothetical protein
MVAILKESKSKGFSWRSIVESLAGHREKALEGYSDLVSRSVAGESFAETDAERVLNLAGKTLDEFTADVERRLERLRLAADIVRLESLAESAYEAEQEESRLVAEHNRRVAEMVAALEPKLVALRELQNSGLSARLQVDDLRRQLIDGCDPGLFEQAKALQGELSEALSIQRNATSQFDDARALAESAENRGDARAEEFRQQEMGLRQWRERSDARVAELNSRLESITAAMVQP